MKIKIQPAIISIVLLFFSLNAVAQNNLTDSNATDTKAKISIYAAAAYATPLHYYGRTDSLKSSAFLPTLIIQAGKHFSVTPSVIFTKNTSTNFDYAATVVNATYTFGELKGIAGSIFGDKFFYKDNSTLVRSVQQGQAGFSIGHLNKILNVTTGASAAFSKANTDYFANAILDHQFKIVKGENIFLVKPSVTANAGTQNFTRSYYKNSGFPVLPPSQQLVTESSKRFAILSYDVNLAATYAVKRFILSVTPGYVLPQNIITDPNNSSLSENAKNLFFCNAVVVYRITK